MDSIMYSGFHEESPQSLLGLFGFELYSGSDMVLRCSILLVNVAGDFDFSKIGELHL